MRMRKMSFFVVGLLYCCFISLKASAHQHTFNQAFIDAFRTMQGFENVTGEQILDLVKQDAKRYVQSCAENLLQNTATHINAWKENPDAFVTGFMPSEQKVAHLCSKKFDCARYVQAAYDYTESEEGANNLDVLKALLGDTEAAKFFRTILSDHVKVVFNASKNGFLFYEKGSLTKKNAVDGPFLSVAYNLNAPDCMQQIMYLAVCPAHVIRNLTPKTRPEVSKLIAFKYFSHHNTLSDSVLRARLACFNRAIVQTDVGLAKFLVKYFFQDINQHSGSKATLLGNFCAYVHYVARDNKDGDQNTFLTIKKLLALQANPFKQARMDDYDKDGASLPAKYIAPYEYIKKLSVDCSLSAEKRSVLVCAAQAMEGSGWALHLKTGRIREKQLLTDVLFSF